MKQKLKQYRQGDVLIEVLAHGHNVPEAKPQKRIILAHGEVTGHAHELRVPKLGRLSVELPREQFRVAGDLDDQRGLSCMALVVSAPTEVVHQEHAPIPLEGETYRVTRQREYSPEEIRNVAD